MRRRRTRLYTVGVAIVSEVRKFKKDRERTFTVGVAIVRKFIGYERAYTVGENCSTKEQKKKERRDAPSQEKKFGIGTETTIERRKRNKRTHLYSRSRNRSKVQEKRNHERAWRSRNCSKERNSFENE